METNLWNNEEFRELYEKVEHIYSFRGLEGLVKFIVSDFNKLKRKITNLEKDIENLRSKLSDPLDEIFVTKQNAPKKLP